MSHTPDQRGFTVIELAVGLALSMILALAVGNIYLQTKASFRTQTAQTRLGEDGRYIVSLFQRMAMQSGYRSWATPNKTSPLALGFTAATPYAAGQTLIETSNVLYTRFYGDADKNIIRCDTNNPTSTDYPSVIDPTAIYSYRIYRDTSDSTIKCAKGGGSDAQVQVSNVVDYALRYGVDTSSTPDGVIDSFVAGTAVTNWNRVYALRMCIVLKSADDNMAPKVKSSTNALIYPTYLDCTLPSQVSQTATDFRLYRTFVTTVFLRNRFE